MFTQNWEETGEQRAVHCAGVLRGIHLAGLTNKLVISCLRQSIRVTNNNAKPFFRMSHATPTIIYSDTGSGVSGTTINDDQCFCDTQIGRIVIEYCLPVPPLRLLGWSLPYLLIKMCPFSCHFENVADQFFISGIQNIDACISLTKTMVSIWRRKIFYMRRCSRRRWHSLIMPSPQGPYSVN